MRRALVISVATLLGCTGTVDGTTFVLYGIADYDASDGSPADSDRGDTTPGDPTPSDGSDPADTSVDANPCTNGTAVFCDDFESATAGNPPPAPWTTATSKGAITVSTTHAHSGDHAVKCTTTISTGDANVFRQALMRITSKDAPITGNDFFGRMMVWFGQVPPNTNLHWSNIEASGKVTTETYKGAPYSASYNYGGQYSHFMGNYNTSGGPATDCWQHSTTIPDPQTWYCVEWQFDGPNDTMRFWLDGAPVDALTMVDQGQGCIAHDLADRWVAPEFDTISLGWEQYQEADFAMEFYVDDVALGPQRIGCPQ